MKFLRYLTEAESGVKEQLIAIKNGTGEWEKRIAAWITGKESQFEFIGSKNFKTVVPKPVPSDIKRKYPDVIFALQALTKHLGSSAYYDKWEEVKNFLTFKPKLNSRTFYRYWTIKEEQLKDLKSGKPIPLPASKGKSTSYTRNPSLWRERPTTFTSSGKTKTLSLSTEDLLQTQGQILTLQTKHTFTPVFDIFYFVTHVLNSVKSVFGKDSIGFERNGLATLRSFAHEREVIGPIITEIKPSDVVGYYRKGTFNKLTDKEYIIKYGSRDYTFLPGDIEKIKDSLRQYGTIDMTYFGNKLIITSDTENSNLKRYTKSFEYNTELSKLIGTKIYLGYWP